MVVQDEKVKIININSRGTAFSFYEEFMGDTTITYVINALNNVFIIDTFLGPKSMTPIKKNLAQKNIESKPKIIINTHSHWDHFWGNNAWDKSNIFLSHSLCRSQIELNGEEELIQMQKYTQGTVDITRLPNLVFEKYISFPEEEIEFFHSPGHTIDSISCFDIKDDVLIIGDNVEDPIPYLTCTDFNSYIKTLQKYIDMNVTTYIIGHGIIQYNLDLIRKNLDYLKKFEKMMVNTSNYNRKELLIHCTNLNEIGKVYKEKLDFEKAIVYYENSKYLLEKAKDEKNRKFIEEIQDILKELHQLK